jgi:hypothetical protein
MFHHSSFSSKGKGEMGDSSSSSRPRSDTAGSLFQVMVFFDFCVLLFLGMKEVMQITCGWGWPLALEKWHQKSSE